MMGAYSMNKGVYVIVIISLIISFFTGFNIAKTFYEGKDISIKNINSLIEDVMRGEGVSLNNPVLYTVKRLINANMTINQVYDLYKETAPFSYGVAYEVFSEVCS